MSECGVGSVSGCDPRGGRERVEEGGESGGGGDGGGQVSSCRAWMDVEGRHRRKGKGEARGIRVIVRDQPHQLKQQRESWCGRPWSAFAPSFFSSCVLVPHSPTLPLSQSFAFSSASTHCHELPFPCPSPHTRHPSAQSKDGVPRVTLWPQRLARPACSSPTHPSNQPCPSISVHPL